MHRTEDWSLNSKINTTIIAIFIILSMIFIFEIVYIFHMFDQRMNETADQNVSVFMKDFESIIQSIEGNGDYFLGDNLIQKNLTSIRSDSGLSEQLAAKRRIADQLDSVLDTMPYIRNITFVLSPVETINSGSGFTLLPEEIEKWDEVAGSLNGRPTYFEKGGQLYYVREIRRKENLFLDHLACLYLRIDIQSMMREIKQKYGLQAAFFRIDHDGMKVYSDIPQSFDESDFHSSSEDIHGGFSYTAWIPKDSITDDLMPVLMVAISALMACSLISLFAGRKLMRSFAFHLGVLEDKMSAMEEGAFNAESFPSYEGRSDEIGHVHQMFNHMAEKIDSLIEENYVKELAIKDSQIRVLTSQTNPHFLYNVLNAIYLKAEEMDARDAASMAWSLASLLRMASANRSVLVPLEEELEYLGHYLDIQKMRFTDRLDFSQSIDIGLFGVNVPRFSIQPLVENAIKHSMEESDEVCHIRLDVHRTGQQMTVSVSNTGSTFPADIEQRIAGGNGHVGLYNMNQRLNLLFKTGLRFENEDNMAIVSFTIPVEGEDVQSASC